MGLDKATLKEEIKQAFLFEQGEELDANESLERIAAKLANAVDKFVKSGKVEIEQGIKVNTTGTAYAQQGKTIEKGIGKVI